MTRHKPPLWQVRDMGPGGGKSRRPRRRPGHILYGLTFMAIPHERLLLCPGRGALTPWLGLSALLRRFMAYPHGPSRRAPACARRSTSVLIMADRYPLPATPYPHRLGVHPFARCFPSLGAVPPAAPLSSSSPEVNRESAECRT